MTYEETVKAIQHSSMTQIPALIQACIDVGKEKGTFLDNRADLFIQTCMERSGVDTGFVPIKGILLKTDGDDIVVIVEWIDGDEIECIRSYQGSDGEITISHHVSALGIALERRDAKLKKQAESQ